MADEKLKKKQDTQINIKFGIQCNAKDQIIMYLHYAPLPHQPHQVRNQMSMKQQYNTTGIKIFFIHLNIKHVSF